VCQKRLVVLSKESNHLSKETSCIKRDLSCIKRDIKRDLSCVKRDTKGDHDLCIYIYIYVYKRHERRPWSPFVSLLTCERSTEIYLVSKETGKETMYDRQDASGEKEIKRDLPCIKRDPLCDNRDLSCIKRDPSSHLKRHPKRRIVYQKRPIGYQKRHQKRPFFVSQERSKESG